MCIRDRGCIAAPIGLFFGRCANFVNGELWGAPTDAPWGVVFGGAAGMMPRHPSQLYEALLEGVVLFLVLYLLSRKRPPRPRGTFLGVFLIPVSYTHLDVYKRQRKSCAARFSASRAA